MPWFDVFQRTRQDLRVISAYRTVYRHIISHNPKWISCEKNDLKQKQPSNYRPANCLKEIECCSSSCNPPGSYKIIVRKIIKIHEVVDFTFENQGKYLGLLQNLTTIIRIKLLISMSMEMSRRSCVSQSCFYIFRSNWPNLR